MARAGALPVPRRVRVGGVGVRHSAGRGAGVPRGTAAHPCGLPAARAGTSPGHPPPTPWGRGGTPTFPAPHKVRAGVPWGHGCPSVRVARGPGRCLSLPSSPFALGAWGAPRFQCSAGCGRVGGWGVRHSAGCGAGCPGVAASRPCGPPVARAGACPSRFPPSPWGVGGPPRFQHLVGCGGWVGGPAPRQARVRGDSHPVGCGDAGAVGPSGAEGPCRVAPAEDRRQDRGDPDKGGHAAGLEEVSPEGPRLPEVRQGPAPQGTQGTGNPHPARARKARAQRRRAQPGNPSGAQRRQGV